MTTELDYQAIRERVDAELSKRKSAARLTLFFISLASYISLFVYGFSQYKNDGVSAMFLLALAGGIAVLTHGLSLTLNTDTWDTYMRDWLASREVNRAILQQAIEQVNQPEKPKGIMRLSDDGELEEIIDDSPQASPSARRSSSS